MKPGSVVVVVVEHDGVLVTEPELLWYETTLEAGIVLYDKV